MKFWISNTDDGEKGILGFNITFFQVIIKEKLKLSMFELGEKYDKSRFDTVLSTSIDLCKVYAGMKQASFVRHFFQNFFESLNMKLSCPLPKNTPGILANATYDDRFLPFIPEEKFYVVEFEVTGVFESQKKWMQFLKVKLFFRCKKSYKWNK
jgi:hypothetical protein